MSLAGYYGKSTGENEWYRKSCRLAELGYPPLPYYSTQELRAMSWMFDSEWEHYMGLRLALCHVAFPRKYTGPNTGAGPAYNQQQEEARIASGKGKLGHKMCAAAPENEYRDPADPRLFDEVSKIKIKQWRWQEKVRRIAEARSKNKGDCQTGTGRVAATPPARVTESASAQQVKRQGRGTIASHAQAASSNNGNRPSFETVSKTPPRVTDYAFTEQVMPRGARTASSHVDHLQSSSDPESYASGARAPGLDRIPEQEQTQRSNTLPTRPSTAVASIEYHHNRFLWDYAVFTCGPDYTRVGEGSSNGNPLRPSSPSFSPWSLDELALAPYHPREAGPLRAVPGHRLTDNSEAIRLLSGSFAEAVLEAGDSASLVDVRS